MNCGEREYAVERPMNPTKEHVKTLVWVLLLVYLFLGLFAFISGRIVGYSLAVWVCAGLAVLVTMVFASIFLLNIAIAGGSSMIRRLLKRK